MTPEKQIEIARRYCEDTLAIAVFRHGTMVMAKSMADVVAIMSAYYVPAHGEGTSAGDMNPLPMDDGHTLITFTEPRIWRPSPFPEGQAFRLASAAEMIALALLVPRSKTETEVFQTIPGADPGLLPACLGARRERTRDAKTPKIVASWSPAPN